jgi:hypothetical protein
MSNVSDRSRGYGDEGLEMVGGGDDQKWVKKTPAGIANEQVHST